MLLFGDITVPLFIAFAFTALLAFAYHEFAHALVADRLGFGTNPNLEQPLETRGVRLLSRVGRLPAPMVSKLVEKYTLQEMFGSSVSHLMEIDGIGPRRARQIRDALLRITESSGR
mgnify:CR=1 FL=1